MIIIRNAKLRDQIDLLDIIIQDGKFKEVGIDLEGDFKEMIDAKGNLLSPPFTESHVHVDSALTLGKTRFNESGTLLEGIEDWSERKQTLTKEDIKKNALEAIKWLIANGVLYIRTHTDSTEKSLMTLEVILEVKEEMKEYIDIQIVAFPQDGIFQYKEMDKLMERAIKMAKKYHKLIDIHTDETGDDQSRFLEVISKYTIENEMEGLVTASHTTAMHNYNNDYAAKLIALVKRAGINIVTNPSSNALLQNRLDGYPRKRGTTRVDQLLESGVNVSIGNDNIDFKV